MTRVTERDVEIIRLLGDGQSQVCTPVTIALGLILLFYAFMALLFFVALYIRRTGVLKTLGTALLLASGLAINAAPALAMQIVVTQVDKNSDGTMTYHFGVKLGQGETLAPGASKDAADFVTVYNL